MDSLTLKDRLQSAGYEFTELGDGTAALISLDKGKIISLNRVATLVVTDLYDDNVRCMGIQDFIDEQSTNISSLFSNPTEVVANDVANFIAELINVIE